LQDFKKGCKPSLRDYGKVPKWIDKHTMNSKHEPHKYAHTQPASNPWELELCRVCWIEEGKVKKSHGQYVRNAHNRMRLILSNGLPAWLEYVGEYTDDDIPF